MKLDFGYDANVHVRYSTGRTSWQTYLRTKPCEVPEFNRNDFEAFVTVTGSGYFPFFRMDRIQILKSDDGYFEPLPMIGRSGLADPKTLEHIVHALSFRRISGQAKRALPSSVKVLNADVDNAEAGLDAALANLVIIDGLPFARVPEPIFWLSEALRTIQSAYLDDRAALGLFIFSLSEHHLIEEAVGLGGGDAKDLFDRARAELHTDIQPHSVDLRRVRTIAGLVIGLLSSRMDVLGEKEVRALFALKQAAGTAGGSAPIVAAIRPLLETVLAVANPGWLPLAHFYLDVSEGYRGQMPREIEMMAL